QRWISPASRSTASSPACACVFASGAAESTVRAASAIASGPVQYQTMCATGAYTNVTQSADTTSSAAKRTRSASAPTISAGANAANVIWNAMKTYSGSLTPFVRVAVSEVCETPERNAFDSPPIQSLYSPPFVNARL